MTHDRLVQFGALIVMIVAVAASGVLLPGILGSSRAHYLRYTDDPVEGAPPIVALGTAIGPIRGVVVDYLWLKVHIMKQNGQFYEVMADADLITKLQPRFAAVWAFHGHNMAYNISVATHTREERWNWVKAGINLVRNEGLRYNPNDLQLHREIAFWFAHKIEGYSDDAHLYYKRQFRREWHQLLGEPPADPDDRVEWIKAIADAPETLQQAEARKPGVIALVEELRSMLAPYERAFRFDLDAEFLRLYSDWSAIKGESAAAQTLGLEAQYRREMPVFADFDAIASNPELREQWKALIAHVRKRVLRDEYNMDPQLMYEFTRDLGPLDWRHGQSHALYWSRKGSLTGEARIIDEDNYYKIVNNDRLQLQAMQALAKGGQITFDPFDPLVREIPTQFPEPLWIDAIDRQFEEFYVKHARLDFPGMRGDNFIDFFQNFMSYAVREAYRMGDLTKAQRILDKLDRLFGTGGAPPTLRYAKPVEAFVIDETQGEYPVQPELARSEVAGMLYYGYTLGLARGRPEIFRRALGKVTEITNFFKSHPDVNFSNKFGEQRMAGLMSDLRDSVVHSFIQVISNPGVPLQDRITIWSKIDEYAPQVKIAAYSEQLRAELQRQLQASSLGARLAVDEAFPAPPNWQELQRRYYEELQRGAEEAARGPASLIEQK